MLKVLIVSAICVLPVAAFAQVGPSPTQPLRPAAPQLNPSLAAKYLGNALSTLGIALDMYNEEVERKDAALQIEIDKWKEYSRPLWDISKPSP